MIGLVADLSIAFGARQLLNLPLTISAGIGLFCAVALNYVSFEYWVYSTKRFSIGRVLKTYAVSLFTLAVRALVIATASAFLVSSAIVDLAILIAAVGVSFVLNYLLIQIVFQPSGSAEDDPSV